MLCFVTGASGFVGANLVHALNARGHRVRTLLRPGADLRGLVGADHEAVAGDLTDPVDSLARAMRGCDWCFHVAASYALWLPDYAPMFRANVDGTRNVLQAAHQAGCSRIVYTSTVGCIGLPKPGTDGTVRPTDESTPVAESQMSNPYKLSKWRAEVVARELAAKGLPVVVVNPSAPIGPRDVKPTPTGKVIVDFLRRAMPAYLDTGLNWVHVRDVCEGHILAAEKGRIGQRYILGHQDGNWTMKQALDVLAEITGIPAPRFRVPYGVAWTAAQVDEVIAKFTGKPPKAPIAGVRMAAYKMWFDPTKAVRELGLPQTPPRQALSDAVDWFRAQGMA
jgi:dihydroflavonol-4-reductase